MHLIDTMVLSELRRRQRDRLGGSLLIGEDGCCGGGGLVTGEEEGQGQAKKTHRGLQVTEQTSSAAPS